MAPQRMTTSQRLRRRMAMGFWRLFNPLARALAGLAPWWVVIETTGRRSGLARRTPLARGPLEDGALWLISTHGRHATWVRNLEAEPVVRIRVRGRWLRGRASVEPLDPARVARFNAYARTAAAGAVGIDPVLVRVTLEDAV